MIIDIHGHYTNAPVELQAYRGRQVVALGRPNRGTLSISDETIRKSLDSGQIEKLKERGTDHMLISPQASAMGHHFGSELVSRYWTETNNDLIHRVCKLYPTFFSGVCQLPQSPGVNPKNCSEELARCVNELGFVGCNLNPDPSGGAEWAASLGEEWWYPLYEKLVALDVPAMIHVSSTVNPALHTTASYYINSDTTAVIQLLESRVFEDFPTLKIVISHGGGSMPYQIARYMGIWAAQKREPSFKEAVKKLYYDTAIYSKEAMEMLIRVVGVDNVLFASEMLGAVNAIDPETGKCFDDNRPYLEAIEWLSYEDRNKIFEQNAKKVYSRLNAI